MNEKIMIVDDALFMRASLKRVLAEAGYSNFLEADNGETACRIYAEEQPDLVLMDISMPIMNGLDALKKIRKKNENAVVVMCSAVGQEAMIMEAVENGAVEFIVKPFKGEQIVNAVKQCLENESR